MAVRLTEIWRYPVKSCRGQRLARAVVEPWGLAGDRRWMVVDSDGRPVTAREHPALVGNVWFGVNLIPDASRSGDVIRTGDPVEVL